MTTLLICNEGKDDKKYHIAYQINLTSPIIPYCRMVGHLDVLVQVRGDNPKLCTKCLKAAGLVDTLASVPLPPAEVVEIAPLRKTQNERAVEALIKLRALADEAMSAEASWWRTKIYAACESAGIESVETTDKPA